MSGNKAQQIGQKLVILKIFFFSQFYAAILSAEELVKIPSQSLKELWSLSQSSDGYVSLDEISVVTGASKNKFATLSLEEVRHLALDNSYALRASQAKSQVSHDLSLASYAGILPTLDLRSGIGRGRSNVSSSLNEGPVGALDKSYQNRKEFYAVLSQPLLDFGSIADIRRMDALQKAHVAEEVGVHTDVVYEASEAFYKAIEAALILKLTHAHEREMERLYNWVDGRFKLGGASGADQARIKARLLMVKSDVKDWVSQLNQANIKLRGITEVQVSSLQLPIPSDVQLEEIPKAISLINTKNSTVRLASANKDAAVQELNKSKARFLPTIKFEISTNRMINSGGMEGGREDDRAMVIFNLPLFSGGADYHKGRASLAKIKQYENEILDARRAAINNLIMAYSGLESAREKITSLSEQVKVQRKVVDAFNSQLSSAVRNLLDVFDAYQQYSESQRALVHTCVQALLLEQQINRITGKLVIDSSVSSLVVED